MMARLWRLAIRRMRFAIAAAQHDIEETSSNEGFALSSAGSR